MKTWFFWLLFSQTKKGKNFTFKVLNIFTCSQAGIHHPAHTFQKWKNKCQCYNLLNASHLITTNSPNLNDFYINLNLS